MATAVSFHGGPETPLFHLLVSVLVWDSKGLWFPWNPHIVVWNFSHPQLGGRINANGGRETLAQFLHFLGGSQLDYKKNNWAPPLAIYDSHSRRFQQESQQRMNHTWTDFPQPPTTNGGRLSASSSASPSLGRPRKEWNVLTRSSFIVRGRRFV